MSLPIVLLILAVVGAACWWFFVRNHGVLVSPFKHPLELDMVAKNWEIGHSLGMPPQPAQEGRGWGFDLPALPGSMHDVTTLLQGFSAHSGMSATVRLDVTGNVSFVTLDGGLVDPVTGFPAKCRLYLQRRGDDGSGLGECEHYRWWSHVGFFELPSGGGVLDGNSRALDAPFADLANWSSVYGKTADSSPEAQAGFAAAIADIDRVGLTFGGRFFGHGVAVQGDGKAHFVCEAFSVQ